VGGNMLSTLLLNIFLAQSLPSDIGSKGKMVLNGGVSEVDKLPAEIYGKWAIHSTLLQAQNRDEFRESTSDMWVFSRVGNGLTLTNPVTEASATINIDEVINKTAKFSRESQTSRKKEIETVQIRIDGERFSGIDTFVIEKYKNGKLISQNVVKYKLQGTKVSGSNSIFD
jgi:hypothetical protein